MSPRAPTHFWNIATSPSSSAHTACLADSVSSPSRRENGRRTGTSVTRTSEPWWELDGRLGHEEAADRWADLDRDLAAAIQEELTIRLGWKQVLAPCRVAIAIGAILTARGWTDEPVPCSRTCPIADVVAG